MKQMSLNAFSTTNKDRAEKYFNHDKSIIFWTVAITGEAGEMANIVKKVMRGDYPLDSKKQEILEEISDIVTYCDLAVSFLGSSLDVELIKKFNKVSERVKYPFIIPRIAR